MKNKIILVSAVIISSIFIFSLTARAQADQSFDPGLIVADESFGNYQAFSGPEGVQRFLELHNSVLANTASSFLLQLKEPADILLKNKLDDPNANMGRLRTAAELIYDAATSNKINPQAILVTLQKEQSLIDGAFSDPNVLQRRLDRALGFACPDAGVCGNLFAGFYFQLFGNLDQDGNRYLGAGKSMAKNFYFTDGNGVQIGRGPMIDASGSTFSSAPKVRTARKGDTITVDNTQGPPNNAPASQTFTIKSAATAALYRYTPHVYNGNYNFWKFFYSWFKYPNGSLIKLNGSEQVFYIDNGERRPVSGTVLALRKLDVTHAFVLSQTEMNDYALAKPLPPPEGSLISPSIGGVRYIVEDSKLRKISDFVSKLRKLDISQTLYLPDNEVTSYETGPLALPPNGTLWKAKSEQVVYLIQDQTMRPISGFVFQQRGYKFSSVIAADDVELAGVAVADPLPPLDGTLVKTPDSPLIYYIALGQKYPIPGFVFKLRKFKFSSVVTLGKDEIDHLALATHLAPADGTLLKAKGSGTVYLVEAGAVHYITAFLFKQGGYKFSLVTEVQPGELALLDQGQPLFIPDDTLVKVQGDQTVYVLQDGSKLPLTYNLFKSRGYKFASVIEITKAESDRYPTGITPSQ